MSEQGNKEQKPQYQQWTGGNLSWSGPRQTQYYNNGSTVVVTSAGREITPREQPRSQIESKSTVTHLLEGDEQVFEVLEFDKNLLNPENQIKSENYKNNDTNNVIDYSVQDFDIIKKTQVDLPSNIQGKDGKKPSDDGSKSHLLAN